MDILNYLYTKIMVVVAVIIWYTNSSWIYNYLCNQCLSPLMLWVSISIRERRTTLCDKVCQWLVTGQWFSPGPPVSSTNKTDRHDITEILLKVALNTIKQTKHLNKNHRNSYFNNVSSQSFCQSQIPVYTNTWHDTWCLIFGPYIINKLSKLCHLSKYFLKILFSLVIW
jgi:hypothetical protein